MHKDISSPNLPNPEFFFSGNILIIDFSLSLIFLIMHICTNLFLIHDFFKGGTFKQHHKNIKNTYVYIKINLNKAKVLNSYILLAFLAWDICFTVLLIKLTFISRISFSESFQWMGTRNSRKKKQG